VLADPDDLAGLRDGREFEIGVRDLPDELLLVNDQLAGL